VSETSAAGGGVVTPGWYTDPHDPRQLRWWSGEGWTEHVSAGAGQPQAAEAAAAQDAPLPSRRALRDPATEASEAAEAALAAQAAQQQAVAAQQQVQQQAAVQAQADQQAQAVAAQQAAQQSAWGAELAAAEPVQPVQPQAAQPQAAQPQAVQPEFGAPVAAQQPSAPVPTLPVAPTSFLEQQGYAPLDGSAPAAQGDWSQPAAGQAAPAQPQAYQPADGQPASAQPNAWNQPVQAVQPVQPVQPTAPNAWNQPVQPAAAQPNAWNQPVQPTQPEQQAWSAPATDGMDSLFGGAPSDQIAAQNPQASQWGLTPSDADSGARPQADEVAGSGTFWAWLIAISPILAAGAVAYVMLTVKPAFTDWPFEAAVAAPYLLVLLFAIADRAALLTLGHSQPRSPAWALLSAPVYLIARAGETRREDGSGTALTLVWFFSVLIAAGGIVGYGFLTHHALIAGLPT
jgi:Protein of unknown function (DUF2510)